jgi:hypothetical protein
MLSLNFIAMMRSGVTRMGDVVSRVGRSRFRKGGFGVEMMGRAIGRLTVVKEA